MKKIDFENGTVTNHILSAALPMLVAQLLNLLYNIVDRIYIARIPDVGTVALGAVGLCFPIIVIITAFSNLFGTGGAPLFAISRIPGWCAHRVEEVVFANRIMRPAYKYLGHEQEYIPLEERG